MELKYYILEVLLRMFCGIIFLFQGYDKLFNVKIDGVIETFRYETSKKHIPQFMLSFVAYYTSIIEFVGGILLILGLFDTAALSLLGIDLLMVAVAFSFLNPVWDMKHVFPRLMLIGLLLLFPGHWNFFSLDYLIHHLK